MHNVTADDQTPQQIIKGHVTRLGLAVLKIYSGIYEYPTTCVGALSPLQSVSRPVILHRCDCKSVQHRAV